MTTRSKKDVRQELFGVQTFEEADEICRKKFQEYTPPDLSLWVKIQLPYKAPNHPDIPSVDEIEQELKVRNLKGQGFRNVCRIGKYFVKSSRGREVLQVSSLLQRPHFNDLYLCIGRRGHVVSPRKFSGPCAYGICNF
jgi:hypothetical protein